MNNITIVLFLIVIFSSCSNPGEKEVISNNYSEAYLRNLVFKSSIDDSCRKKIVDSLLKAVEKDSTVYIRIIRFFEKSFSDPNFSFRNEKMSIMLLEQIIKSKWFTQSEKKSAGEKINLLHQNNIGFAANDFSFIKPDGDRYNLYSIKANFILIYFYNPECNACKNMQDGLLLSMIIHNRVLKGELVVLSIYTDSDIKIWKNHLREQPIQWIQGRDENECLYKNRIYDLKAIPSIYLIDRNKIVILKDCTSIKDIESALH